MCGRYTLASTADELVEAFDVPVPTFELTPRYNVAPSQLAPVVAEDRHGRRLGMLTWGFVPRAAADVGSAIINARSESVADKPSFRDAFARRRCLIPADGFYEWKASGGAKVPYWIHPRAGGLLSFAGIWETWSRGDAEQRHGFAILTRDANEDVAMVHDRMPVIVGADDRAAWLDRGTAPGLLLDLLRAAPPAALAHHEVSRRVNRPSEDGAELVAPV
jgi:putative SOS response-associated peptidase YedK